MGDWISVIGTLSGVAVGGLLSHFLTMRLARHERRWQTQLDLRKKLEEIGSLTDEIYWRYAGCLRSTNEWGAGRLESPETDFPPLGRLRVLVSSYGSSRLQQLLAAIEERADIAQKAVLEMGHRRESAKQQRQEAARDLAEAEFALKAACEALGSEAAREISKEVDKAMARKREGD